jgi:hypothetical protein
MKRWIAPGAEAERVTGGVRLALPRPFSFTATNTVTSPSLLAPTELDFGPERTQTRAPPPPLAPRPNLALFPKLYHRQSKIFLVLSFKAAGDESLKLDPFRWVYSSDFWHRARGRDARPIGQDISSFFQLATPEINFSPARVLLLRRGRRWSRISGECEAQTKTWRSSRCSQEAIGLDLALSHAMVLEFFVTKGASPLRVEEKENRKIKENPEKKWKNKKEKNYLIF